MPTPTPEAAEIETTREMMGENSYSRVESLINAGNDAQWAATLADITEWNTKVRGKYVELDGKVKLKPSTRAYAIRARVRTRYGLTEQVDQSVRGGSASLPGTVVINSSLGWSVSTEVTEAYAEAFDAEREVLLGEDATLLLLKPDESVQKEITSGWTARFSDFYDAGLFEVADTSLEFGADVHVGALLTITGSDIPVLNNVVFKLTRQTQPPPIDEPVWKLRAAATERRYSP